MKDVSLKTYHLSLSRMNILILLSSPPYGPFPARRTGGTAITAAGKSLGPSRGRPRWRMDGERSPKHPEKHHNFRGHEIIHFGGIKKHCQWKVIISWPLFFWAVQCIWVCDFFFQVIHWSLPYLEDQPLRGGDFIFFDFWAVLSYLGTMNPVLTNMFILKPRASWVGKP